MLPYDRSPASPFGHPTWPVLQYLDVSVNKETKLITSALHPHPLRGLEPPSSLILRHLWSLLISCYTLKVTMLGNNIKISLNINKVREGSWSLRDRNIRLRPTEERKRTAGTEGKAKSNLHQLLHEDHHRVSQQYFLKTETPVATCTSYGPVSKVRSPLPSCRECSWWPRGAGVVAGKTVIL